MTIKATSADIQQLLLCVLNSNSLTLSDKDRERLIEDLCWLLKNGGREFTITATEKAP